LLATVQRFVAAFFPLDPPLALVRLFHVLTLAGSFGGCNTPVLLEVGAYLAHQKPERRAHHETRGGEAHENRRKARDGFQRNGKREREFHHGFFFFLRSFCPTDNLTLTGCGVGCNS